MRDALPVSMRRVYLSGSFIALLVALCAFWAFRFERSPGFPTWHLADLRAVAPPIPGLEWTGSPDHPKLRVRVDAANPQVAARLCIPGVSAVEMLHLRFRMSARGLTPGAEKWDDGRFMIEWHPPGGGSWENDPVCSLRLNDQSGPEEFVVRPQQSPAFPALRIEHLGRSGEFEIADLEITAIHERPLWRSFRWFLALGWLAWGIACVRSWPGVKWQRAICASAIWVLMGFQLVIPGPWKIQRAMYPEFQIGKEVPELRKRPPTPGSLQTRQDTSEMKSGPLPALGKIPYQGDFVLRVKLRISEARPLLHILMLLVPALVIAWLVGRKPALLLMVMLALAIELAQVAFGYGFGWDDVFDLATDAFGIGLAMWAYGKMLKTEKLKN